MTLVRCVHDGALVGPNEWYPSEPFDYAWRTTFGCNHLRCDGCGEEVTVELVDGDQARRYRCRCQSRDEYSYLVLGADRGLLHEFVTQWHCAGHPRLALPVTLDGVAIPEVGDFGAIVAATLTTPPFKPPRIDERTFWVQRLYNLVPAAAQRDAISRAVATHLGGPDVARERAAIEFFWRERRAAGAEEVAKLALRDRARLEQTPDPMKPRRSLYQAVLSPILGRLGVRNADGSAADVAAVQVARDVLLDGGGVGSMLFSLVEIDRAWFFDHAVDIVRANPDTLEYVLGAALKVPREHRPQLVDKLSKLDAAYPAVIQAWLDGLPSADRARW
jgi:hypothetical protein